MATAKKYSMNGADLGAVELDDAVFGVEMNPVLVHGVVVALQNARRQGDAETKTRAEISGGGRKPYRQKGTGNARHGSTREPQMRGGGTVWGPHKRGYRHDVPAKTRRRALCCALSERVRSEDLCVLDTLTCETARTKPFAAMNGKFAPNGERTLYVTAGVNNTVLLSARNIPRVEIRTAADLNALDVMGAKRVVVEEQAVAKLEERLK